MARNDVERLETENARLRRVLDYAAKSPEKWIPAAVLSQNGPAVCGHCALRLDRGSLAGIRVGAVAAVPEGLVGIVTRVTAHTSEVALITDPSVLVACEVEGSGTYRPRGIIAGGTDEMLSLRHLRHGTQVLANSRVVTSGLGGVFPRGLEVGTLMSPCEVLPSVDFASLEDVFLRREK